MPGFNWDGETFTPGESSGGAFVDAEKFNKWIYTDQVVFITAIREGINTYDKDDPKPQWLVDFIGPDGEEYTKGVGKGNAERDARMVRFRNTLAAAPDEPIPSTPIKVPGSGQPRIEFGPPKASA